jgi:hypothetical protein
MSPRIDDEEIASLVEEKTGTGSQRRVNSSTRGSTNTPGSFRSCWLIASAFFAALFIIALFTDATEMKINMGAAAIEDKVFA